MLPWGAKALDYAQMRLAVPGGMMVGVLKSPVDMMPSGPLLLHLILEFGIYVKSRSLERNELYVENRRAVEMAMTAV